MIVVIVVVVVVLVYTTNTMGFIFAPLLRALGTRTHI